MASNYLRVIEEDPLFPKEPMKREKRSVVENFIILLAK